MFGNMWFLPLIVFGLFVGEMVLAEPFVMQGAGTKSALIVHNENSLVLKVERGKVEDYKPDKSFTLTVGTYKFDIKTYIVSNDVLYEFINEKGAKSSPIALTNLKIGLQNLTFNNDETNPLVCDQDKFGWNYDKNVVTLTLGGDVPPNLILRAERNATLTETPTTTESPEDEDSAHTTSFTFGLLAFFSVALFLIGPK